MASKRASSGLTFKATMAQVSVPASSANVGPGFDCFGIALELRDRYAAQVLDDPTSVSYTHLTLPTNREV